MAADFAFRRSDFRMGLWVLLALLYLTLRFGFTPQLDALGPYASYIFEIACVSSAFALAWRGNRVSWRFPRGLAWMSALSLGMGYAIFRGAVAAEITIPFELSGRETLLFLLLVAPILEEMIFRFLLWQPIEVLSGRAWAAWLGSALVFSYSHLHAIWFVSRDIHAFIIYQTVYTLFLGLACGSCILRERSLAGAIAMHFTFNLGFYMASLV